MRRARFFGVLCITVSFGGLAIVPARAADTTFEIYGFAQADFIHDFQRMDPNWEDAFRPSKIATPEGEFGTNGQSSVSVKQSQFGVKGEHPTDTDLGPIKFRFEFDLFGVGVNEGQTTFRLRHAYGEWSMLLAGQTNSVFMDGDVFPNVIDYWGPPGMVFLRNPQLRVTPWRTDHMHVAFAIERPLSDIDPGEIREIDPALGANLQNDEKLPDFTAHWNWSDDWGHVQVAGILREVGFDTLNTPGNNPHAELLGWGVNVSGHVNTIGKDRIVASVVHGEAIATYMNDGGVDMAPGGTPESRFPLAVPLTGMVAYYDRYWNDNWSTAAGYSFTEVENTSLQEPGAFHEGQYASLNLLYTPEPDIMLGVEGLWGKRTDNDGIGGEDWRIQFSAKYKFGTKFEL